MTVPGRPVRETTAPNPGLLPPGAAGIDAGLTLTKVVRATADALTLTAFATGDGIALPPAPTNVGVTGARLGPLRDAPGAVRTGEIEAAALGAAALLRAEGAAADEFLLVLIGTGTACAAVRGDAVQHLGGTPLGGGSFAGIARRLAPGLTQAELIAAATRGDRARVDLLISDVYPDGIGRIGPEMTAAHLARDADAALDDVLAGLLNLHGENIAQIAASRAHIAKLRRLVLAGGFVAENPRLVASAAAMAALFGLEAEVAPLPGFAGAVGAALAAVRARP